MRDLVINYVDAPPGTGKTRAVIEYMRRHIEASKKSDTPVGHIMYVAPTQKLLDQTCAGLEAVVPRRDHKLIFKVYSTQVRERKVDLASRVYAVLNGRNVQSGVKAAPYVSGSVLFLTHATFLRLKKKHPSFASTTLFFDESRKWVEKIKLKKEPGLNLLLKSLFKIKKLKTGPDTPGTIARLLPKSLAENRKLTKLKSKNLLGQFATLDSIHSDLVPKINEVIRKQVYMVSTTTHLWTITLPHYPFQGFKRVFIMSADFEHSQMYHLFAAESRVRLKPVTHKFMDRYLEGGYYAALQRIHERQSKLRILPLLKYEGMPSKYKLNNFILPEGMLYALKAEMDKHDISTDLLATMLRARHDPSFFRSELTAGQQKFLDRISKYDTKTDVVQWMVTEAERILRTRWFRSKNEKALLFVNKDKMSKIKFDDRVFSLLSIGLAEGNNQYKDYRAVVFLPAVNPEPEEARVLKALLPNYNPDEDYILDKANQCIGRGNIRNHESKEKMLAIVSTTELADKLHQRMAVGAKVYDPEEYFTGPVYTFWDYGKASATHEEGVRARDLPINKLIANARSNISRQVRNGNKEKEAHYRKVLAELLERKKRLG